jgi:uncharacterized Zn finger protein
MVIQRYQERHHLIEECADVVVSCMECQQKMTRRKLTKHVFEECEYTSEQMKRCYRVLKVRFSWEDKHLGFLSSLKQEVQNNKIEAKNMKLMLMSQQKVITYLVENAR